MNSARHQCDASLLLSTSNVYYHPAATLLDFATSDNHVEASVGSFPADRNILRTYSALQTLKGGAPVVLIVE